MSEQENNVFMEQAEYMEYLRNQIKDTPAAKQPIAQITMYQMNKDIVKSLKKMNNMDVNKALEKVTEWFDPKETHYALLNHEHHYFTIFEVSETDIAGNAESFIHEVKDVLMNYYADHDLRAIDIDSNGAVEIWAMWDGEPTVAYLFPYGQGVVYY
jgi:hypothetical protein